MQNPTYLIRSEHCIFHFRWPLPLRLMPDSKRRYIKLSLGTREPQEALYLARGLSYAAAWLIKHPRLQGMDFIEIKALVQTYLQRALEEAKEGMNWHGVNPKELAVYWMIAEDPKAFWETHNGTEEETKALSRICKKMDLPIDESDPEWARLQQVYRSAIPHYCKEVVQYANQLTSEFTFTQTEQAAVTQPAKPRNAGLHTLEKTIQQFIAAHVNDEAWDDNTKNDKQAKFAVLVDALGKDYLIADMDLMKAREIRDLIKQLPKNLNKNPQLRGKSLMEAVGIEGLERLSAVTVQKYLNAYSALYQWCMDEGMVNDNPFAKVKATVDRKKKGEVARKPFNADQIKMIQAAIEGEAKHYRKWGTLIGMYTGARLNEVAQIALDDIKQKDGIWYFHMNDEGDNKKLKTPAARRLVPIHKALLDLGILEEIERLRSAGQTRFLHELTYDKKNGYGKKLGHYFNQVLLPALGIKRKELVFHSLRHTANTCLYQAGVPEPIVHTIIGHERSGTSQQVYFKEGYTIQQLKEAMDKFDPARIVINSD